MSDDFKFEEEKWIPHIGRFIIDFAYIEDSLYTVIKSHLKNTHISQNSLKTSFNVQLSLFKEIFLNEVSNTDEIMVLIESFVDEVSRLRVIRNAIAHNSLGLLFERKDNGEMEMIGFEIENKTKQNVSANYDTFIRHTEELKACRGDLEKLMEIFQRNEDELIIANISVQKIE
jgi:hypothetical protein